MEKKKDGFPNEKAIVIPQEILLKVQKNPMTSLPIRPISATIPMRRTIIGNGKEAVNNTF